MLLAQWIGAGLPLSSRHGLQSQNIPPETGLHKAFGIKHQNIAWMCLLHSAVQHQVVRRTAVCSERWAGQTHRRINRRHATVQRCLGALCSIHSGGAKITQLLELQLLNGRTHDVRQILFRHTGQAGTGDADRTAVKVWTISCVVRRNASTSAGAWQCSGEMRTAPCKPNASSMRRE